MAAWLAFAMAEPPLLHACPMHGGASVHGGVQKADHAMRSDAASHHSSQRSNASRPEPRDSESHDCTCLGQCCSAPPIGLPSARVALAGLTSSTLRDTGLPQYEYVLVAAEHTLPFQNGPPAAL